MMCDDAQVHLESYSEFANMHNVSNLLCVYCMCDLGYVMVSCSKKPRQRVHCFAVLSANDNLIRPVCTVRVRDPPPAIEGYI